MNRMMLIPMVGLVAAVMCGGCSRLVTIEPELVSSRNDASWTIQSAPEAVPAQAAKAPPAPVPAAASPAAPAPAEGNASAAAPAGP